MGGAEQLLKQVGELMQSRGLDVILIDAPDGWLTLNSRIDKKIVISNHSKITLDDDGILITAASRAFDIEEMFSFSKCRILFWNLHPYNLIPSVYYLRRLRIQFLDKLKLLSRIVNFKHQRLVSSLLDTSALALMDGECNRAIREYYGKNVNKYLPVFLSQEKFSKSSKGNRRKEKKTIKAVWLGRIDLDFKIHVLIKIIEDIKSVSEVQKLPIEMTVVGNGPGLSLIKEKFVTTDNFSIFFVNEKSGEELRNLINTNDIGFAMGMSALELAAQKLPTILLDFSYRPIREEYKYKWLFDSDAFVLGRDIHHMNESERVIGDSMSIVLSRASHDRKLGNKSYNYVLSNHSEDFFYKRLFAIINETSLTVSGFLRYE